MGGHMPGLIQTAENMPRIPVPFPENQAVPEVAT